MTEALSPYLASFASL